MHVCLGVAGRYEQVLRLGIGAAWTWSVQSGSVAAVHVILFQMSRTVLALMPYSAPTVLDRALSEILPRVARASGESMEGRIEKICARGMPSGSKLD